MPKLAIIGGTGVYDPHILSNLREQTIDTEYGNVSLVVGEYAGKEVVFLNRHGKGHALPPHKVNYRANVMALKQIGVEKVIATAAVGSTNIDMKPGAMVLCHQFIDFTKNRIQTFYEDGVKGVVHVDMTDPYCPELRGSIREAARAAKISVIDGGTYVCTEGPRFETPAEIKMFKQWGGDLVGMTGVPEVILAREAELCYAVVAVVTNYAAGMSRTPLSHAEVLEAMQDATARFKNLITKLIEITPGERSCVCQTALSELGTLGK